MSESFTMPTLTDECIEVAYSAIRIRGLYKELSNEAWDALAKEHAPQIAAYALDLVDKKLAEIDAEKQRLEAA